LTAEKGRKRKKKARGGQLGGRTEKKKGKKEDRPIR